MSYSGVSQIKRRLRAQSEQDIKLRNIIKKLADQLFPMSNIKI